MSTKIRTSIEQSKKLLSLGLDPNTADMFYTFNRDFNGNIIGFLPSPLVSDGFIDIDGGEIPCWSLTALLELMPIGSHIEKKKNCYACYAVYTKPLESSTPIEAAFETVCWLIEHGYIKVNK